MKERDEVDLYLSVKSMREEKKNKLSKYHLDAIN